MALKKDLNYKGIFIKDCYMKVHTYEGDKSRVRFYVGIHKDDKSPMIDSMFFEMISQTNNGSSISEIYNYLKTLPEFSGALDC